MGDQSLLNHPLIVAQSMASLPEKSFIRALPFSVEITQRLRLDAVVVCADIIASAYIQMFNLALQSGAMSILSNGLQEKHLDVALFQHAWSIVDQAYGLRHLIHSLQFSGASTDQLMLTTEKAHILRNRMDHLNQHIPNIAMSKSSTRSLFGSLSYFLSGAAIGKPDVETFGVIQQIEPARAGEQIGALPMPVELRMPAGNFTLSAAGESLDIDGIIIALGSFMIRVNEDVERIVRSQISDVAKKRGIAESDLLNHHGASYKFMMALHSGLAQP